MNYKYKKIAIISSSFPPLSSGGISSANFYLYLALKKIGYQVKVFTYADTKTQNRESDIIRCGTPEILAKIIYILTELFFKIQHYQQSSYQVADITSSIIGVLHIRNKIERFSPDILIIPDHDCPALCLPKISGSKYILVSHHNPMRFVNNPLLNLHNLTDAKLASSIENYSLNKIDQIVCPSQYMKNFFLQTHPTAKAVRVIPNLVDETDIGKIKKIDIHKRLSLEKNAPIVYIPSAGNQFKGSDFVFEIIRRLGSTYGQQIGFYLSGSLNPKLQYQLKYLPKNIKIFSPGRIAHNINLSYVKDCSFCISPTLIESFGMALLEANFCGLPVVCFDTGGTKDVIKNNKNGYLVDYLNIEKLLSCSQKFLNTSFRNKMSKSARSYVKDIFKQEAIINQWEDLFAKT
ncbi:MAG: glycosyltransferase family 4 protein [Patescibacteria group bacterium]|nr:glycosyltransferase family 4 protein [Patescibacteria group bacterium]